MGKKIISIGFTIPGADEECEDHSSTQSLLDADIVIFEPEHLWSSSTYHGKPEYNQNDSFDLIEETNHWLKEILTALESGKTIFVFFKKYEEIFLNTEGHIHPDQKYDNYKFMPLELPPIVPKSGGTIKFNNNPIFSVFWNEYKNSLKYESYIDGKIKEPLFTTKIGNKPIGGLFKVSKGNLVLLPPLSFPEDRFVEEKEGEEYWTDEACQFGRKLTSLLIDIDVALRAEQETMPPPQWASKSKYLSPQEKTIKSDITKIIQKVDKLLEKKTGLLSKLNKEESLKNLLFSKGRPLENAITEALEILGYKAKNYDDGNLELDHVIISPEGDRLIGEAEGKDNSAINIDKFRQLSSNIQEDIQRNDISKPAIGILFGNGFRLMEPNKRPEQFTQKCINTNKTFSHILIRTTDLFEVAKYIKNSGDKKFSKRCREAIKNGMGKIVSFSKIPSQSK